MKRLPVYLVEGVFAGLLGGMLVGTIEALWYIARTSDLIEFGILWWGALAYAVFFLPIGAAVGLGMPLLRALIRRDTSRGLAFALALGGALAAAVALIGRWRFYADFRMGRIDTPSEKLLIAAIALAAALVVWVVVTWITNRLVAADRGTAKRALLAIGAILLVVLTAAAFDRAMRKSDIIGTYQPDAAAEAPNILFIVADTLRADYLKAFNPAAWANTPNLGALASDSVKFEKFFAQGSWTKPSFCSMFTSLYPRSHTGTNEYARLPDDLTTFPEVLTERGYYTMAITNCNPNVAKPMNLSQGFVEYTDLTPSHFYFGAPHSATHSVLYDRILAKCYTRFVSADTRIRHFYQPAPVVTDRALSWLDGLRRPEEKPFFFMIHYMDPHDPYMSGKDVGLGYNMATAQLSSSDRLRLKDELIAAYIADIERMDRSLGELFAGLKQRGLYDDAVIVFLSDHGEEFHDHSDWWHGFSLYDEMIHVPLLIKLPGSTAKGSANPHLARQIDIGPTLLQFAGAPVPTAMVGQPLLALDGTAMNESIAYAFSESDRLKTTLEAVRLPDMKLVDVLSDAKDRFAPKELFDMVADPAESQNLAGQSHPREGELQQLLDSLVEFAKGNAAKPEAMEVLPPNLQDQLDALGYLE